MLKKEPTRGPRTGCPFIQMVAIDNLATLTAAPGLWSVAGAAVDIGMEKQTRGEHFSTWLWCSGGPTGNVWGFLSGP